MSPARQPRPALGDDLLGLYDAAVADVYGYLFARCGRRREVAEDLTAETFLAAVDSVRRDAVPLLSTAWLIGVARHKLADHWRRNARDERRLRSVEGEAASAGQAEDPWDVTLDALDAHSLLDRLSTQHRAALTLRYLDALPVPEVAGLLGRTVHATEALLVRARVAFRAAYEEGAAR